MKKNSFMNFSMGIIAFLILYIPAFAETAVTVKTGSDTETITAALNGLSENSGDVTLNLESTITEPGDVSIPTDKGITSVTLTTTQNAYIDVLLNDHSIYANGIPLTIGKNLILRKSTLYGGSQVIDGKKVTLPSSKIDLEGTADYVFSGGYAFGIGSESNVDAAEITVGGTVNVIAYAGGQSSYRGKTENKAVKITKTAGGKINQIRCYGLAAGDEYYDPNYFESLAACQAKYLDNCKEIKVDMNVYMNVGSHMRIDYHAPGDESSVQQTRYVGWDTANATQSHTGTVDLSIQGEMTGYILKDGENSNGGIMSVDQVNQENQN